MELILRILVAFIIYGGIVAAAILAWRLLMTRRQLDEVVGTRFVLLEILVPRNNEKGPLAAESMFASLHGIYETSRLSQEKISFEIASREKYILFYTHVPAHLKDFVEGQIYAQYPTVEIKEVEDYSQDLTEGTIGVAGTELLLNRNEVFPIKTFQNFEVDPLAGITGVLSKVEGSQQIWIQFMLKPVGDSWQQKGIDYVAALKEGRNPEHSEGIGSKIAKGAIGLASQVIRQAVGGTGGGGAEGAESAPPEGGEAPSLSGPEEAAVKGIEEKVTKLGFETKIRIVSIGESQEQAKLKVQNVVGSFKQFNTTNQNGFTQTSFIEPEKLLQDYRSRAFSEKGYIFNITELASIFHLPNVTVETPSIAWAGSKKGEPPANLPIEASMPQDELTLYGQTNFRHLNQRFGIKLKDRRLHTYVIGKTGTGKSTLLENMIIDDIANGRGVAVVDPHGDLISHVLDFIPPERVNDVVWFAPYDREYPVGFNVMDSVDEDLKSVIASGVVGIFKKIFGESWGPRLEYILRNAVLSLIGYPNATLLGVTRILVDKDYRKKVVETLNDPVLRDFWINEFDKYDIKFRTEAVAPIQNKVGQFLSSATIRNIVGQPLSTINMKEIMDARKILLVDLSIGKIGEDVSALLGAMVITKIQITALERANIVEADRVDFYLYVDEFQNFATDSFAVILSEARKYKLNLIMTNQFIAQMPEIVAKAVFGNVGTLLSFRVGAQDAPVLVSEFEPVFDANDLVNLDNYQIYVKMAIDGVTSPAFSATTLAPRTQKQGNREKVVTQSRERYTRPREFVEKKIEEWSLQDSSALRIMAGGKLPEGEKSVQAEQKTVDRSQSSEPQRVGDYFRYSGAKGIMWYEKLPSEQKSPTGQSMGLKKHSEEEIKPLKPIE